MKATETLPPGSHSRLEPETEKAPSSKGGPRTAEGKARSALNNLRHGLTGSFRIAENESREEFESLVEALREEHEPATATEELLLQRMAQHFWLSRRAEQLHDPAALIDNPSHFALMLRYQAMHERGFHKCLTELRKAKKERLEQERAAQQEFESQQAFGPVIVKLSPDVCDRPTPRDSGSDHQDPADPRNWAVHYPKKSTQS